MGKQAPVLWCPALPLGWPISEDRSYSAPNVGRTNLTVSRSGQEVL
jgi:hypothetical protein